MKLVNIHILVYILLFIIIGLNSAHAQVWSLQQCIDTAQVHNKNLKIAMNNVSIGEQKEIEARANLIPKLTALADYRYYFNLPYQLMPLSAFGGPPEQYKAIQFGVPNVINANIQLSMPVYNPQVYGAIQTTKIASDLIKLQYNKSEELIYFEISNLYYNAQILYHQIAFIDSNLKNVNKVLKNIILLNEQLLINGTEVSKVKLQVSQLITLKENLNSKFQQVLNTLKFAMGVPIEQNLQIEKNIQYQTLADYTINSTTDLRIAKTQNRILSRDLITLNKSKYLPSLNLIGTYGTTGFGFMGESNNFLDFYPIGFIGIQLTYPLFNGTITQRKINQKRLEIQNNDLQSELISSQNSMQVENIKMQIEIAKKSVETITEQIQLAQIIYEQTVIQQKQGTAGLTEIIMADNAIREAQQMYLSAVIEYLKAELDIKKLTGNIPTTK